MKSHESLLRERTFVANRSMRRFWDNDPCWKSVIRGISPSGITLDPPWSISKMGVPWNPLAAAEICSPCHSQQRSQGGEQWSAGWHQSSWGSAKIKSFPKTAFTLLWGCVVQRWMNKHWWYLSYLSQEQPLLTKYIQILMDKASWCLGFMDH